MRPAANSVESPGPDVTRPGDAPRAAQRVSVMYGDRLCTKCSYNLIGQPVLREPHYDMLIVRCPECATVASVQDFPQLGRWAHRWAIILSVLWLLVILGVTGGAMPAMIATSIVFSEENSDHYESALQERYVTWYEANHGPATNTSWWAPDKFDEWMAAEPPSTILADSGGFWRAIFHPELLFALIPGAMAFVYGCFIAVALVHRRRRTLILMAFGLIAVWGGIYATAWWQIAKHESIDNFYDLAWLQVCLPHIGVVFGWVWTVMIAGVLAGRPLARTLVRLLLPPHLRPSVAVLWTTDGYRVPAGPERPA